MADLLELVDAILWLILVLLLFRDLRKWNNRLQALYDEMEKEIRND